MNMGDSVRRAMAARASRGVGNNPSAVSANNPVGPPRPSPAATPVTGARPKKVKRTMGDTVRSAIASRAKRGVSSSDVVQKIRQRRGMM